MKLNIEDIEPWLKGQGFRMIEATSSFVRFDSFMVSLLFSYDERSNEFFVQIGYKYDDVMFEYIDFSCAIDLIFSSKKANKILPTNFTTKGMFQYYMKLLSENKYIPEGDSTFFRKLKDHFNRETKKYNSKLLFRQKKLIADKEWSDGNYGKFIATLSEMDVNDLPYSYKLKYNFAVKKLKKK